MPTIDDFGKPIDTSVVNLARAIRQKESQGNYDAKGASGESGAYQWMPGNFEAAAKKYGLNPNDRSATNQDKVAYYSLLADKSSGLKPEQIAAKWNSGSSTGWEKKVGTNSKGVKYDVPAYVKEVMQLFEQQKLAAQGAGLPPKTGGFSLVPKAEAAKIDSLPQDQNSQYDETELMLMGKAGIKPGQQMQMQAPQTVGSVLADLGIGAVKGAQSTSKNVLDFFSPILGAINLPGQVAEFVTGGRVKAEAPFQASFKTGERVTDQELEATNTAQAIGKGAERVAEFVAPTKLIKGAQIGINTLIQGSKLLPTAGRVLAKAGVEAAAGATIATAQTGDLKEGLKTGALFGGLKAATGAIGETAKALRLPERIYSSIFKNTYKDVIYELKTAGAKAFQKSNPQEFADLVTSGIIKVGQNGVININETLAKQALDRGLKGSLKNMANSVVRDLYRSEARVQAAAKGAKETVDVSEKQFSTVLRQIQTAYKDVGFGQFSAKAKALADVIKKTKGKVDAPTALAIRRLLDSLRGQRSFDATAPTLSLTQQNLKFLADTLRSRVNKIPGMPEPMKDYVFNIDALEHIGKEAARTGNRQIISLLDAIFFGGGAVSAQPAVGAALGLARRVLTVPASATRIAQGIQNSGAVTKTGQAIRGLITSLRPFQEDRQQEDLQNTQ